MIKSFVSILLMTFSVQLLAVTETTSYGKITGIESRAWGMHIQTNFSGGKANGCEVTPSVGNYMYDFQYNNGLNGDSADDEISMILAAFAAQTDISFHIYSCNEAGNRPVIGYVRVKK